MSYFPEFVRLTNGDMMSNVATEAPALKRHRLGCLALTADGRIFRRGEVGGTNIATARLTQSEVPDANMDELVIPTARAINDRTITATLGATNPADNDFAQGYLNVEDDAGEGHLYSIESETDDGTTITLELEGGHGLVVALTTASTVGIWKNPWRDIIIHPSPPTASLTGVTPRAHAASRDGWFQVGGLASVLIDGTVVIGFSVMASNGTDGAVEAFGLTEAAPNTEIAVNVGTVHEVAATTEEGTIMLGMALGA